jgi:hypothetical protein
MPSAIKRRNYLFMRIKSSKPKAPTKNKSSKEQLYYLHITDKGTQRVPFTSLPSDKLKKLIGNQSGDCTLAHTTNYLTNRDATIVHDDLFLNTDWPVTAQINNHLFKGAFVIIGDRDKPPYEPVGLTDDECDEIDAQIQYPLPFDLPGYELRSSKSPKPPVG